MDLHKDSNISLVNNTYLFYARDLKRYNPFKDQTIFDPIHRLPMYILESIGLTNLEVVDHIMATSVLVSYYSSPPRPLQPTEVQDLQPKPKRFKSLAIKRTPENVVAKSAGDQQKRKTTPTVSTPQDQTSPSKANDPPVNVIKDSLNEPLESGDVFRRKNLNTPSQSQKQKMTDA